MTVMMHVSFPIVPFDSRLFSQSPGAATSEAAEAITTLLAGPMAHGDDRVTAGRASSRPTSRVAAAVDPEEDEEDLGDEEDLTVAQPAADDESSFDDFDDEFDDDFEEEENDPDWDHPEENEPPPPGQAPSKKK